MLKDDLIRIRHMPDAALKIAREAFKGTKLTMKDINNAVKSVRREAYGKKSRAVI
jgi:hypothetical protein